MNDSRRAAVARKNPLPEKIEGAGQPALPDGLMSELIGAIMLVSPEGNIISWNAAAEALFGYKAEEAVGRSKFELLIPPEEHEEALRWLRVAMARGSALYEGARRRKDGVRVFVEVTARAIHGDGGRVDSVVLNERDITLLKYARDAKVLQARFQGILDAAPDAIAVVDLEGRIVFVNPEAERLFGYDRDELLGRFVEDLVPERFLASHPGHRTGYFADPRARPMGSSVELWGRRRDGREFPVEISLSPLKVEDRTLAMAAIRDVTVRQKAQAKVRGVLEAAPDAMVIVDQGGRIVLVNSQAEKVFGYTREELLGQTIETLVPERFQAVHPRHRTGYLAAPHTRPMGSGLELWGRRKDGTEFPVEISLSPVETEDGTLVTAAVRDITERKRLLQELQCRSSELEIQSRRAQEANRLKSEFLANMSHELRTPLNAIIGFAELMHDGKVGPVAPQHKEFLGDILTSSRHLLQLINDVLDLAKVESGKMEFRPEPVDLERVVSEVRDILRTLAAKKRITIETQIAPMLQTVHLDPAKLKQVLYNYLSNALKFTPNKGRVLVRVLPEGPDRLRLEVEDTGIGIKPEHIGKLFTEFQQLDASTAKKYTGTGLGLALTKRIIEAQGGEVGVHSTLGEGSVFFAVLPRVIAAAPTSEENGGPIPLTAAANGIPRVLVIEDNPADRAWLARTIADQRLSVETAVNGANAIARCGARAFDVITLDLILPDMSGWDVLKAIRADGLNRETPIIVVTIAAEAGSAIGFRIHDFLSKPLEARDLRGSLERLGLLGKDGRRILVVDDVPQDLRLAEQILRGAGFVPVCVRDAFAALKAAKTEPPAAVLLDLMMPGMDGFRFLERFRRTRHGRCTPVIVWTMKELSVAERVELQTAAQAIVQKGVSGTEQLVGELRAHLRGAGGPVRGR